MEQRRTEEDLQESYERLKKTQTQLIHSAKLAAVGRLAAGAAHGISIALIQILLLVWSSEDMRCRVSGARVFSISTIMLGNLLTGWAAGVMSAGPVIVINCAASILITVLITLWAPELIRRN